MADFEDVIKNMEETQYREVRVTQRSVRDKMRALRDEFGFQPTEPKKVEESNED